MKPRIPARKGNLGSGCRGLVEREWELAALEHSVAAAQAGAGSTVMIEAYAGRGRSRLLAVAAEMASQAGIRLVEATATELERDFPFGLALALLEPVWHASTPQERRSLLSGPAQLAARLLSGEDGMAKKLEGQQYPLIHSLFWLTHNLIFDPPEAAAGEALMIAVDDLQWADAPSLRFLAYLAERLVELPLAMILAVRRGETFGDPGAVAGLGRAAGSAYLRPEPLSLAGVTSVVTKQFPQAQPSFCQACAEVTAGNPFLLVALLDKLRADERPLGGVTAEGLAELVPEQVQTWVSDRLRNLPSDAREVIKALSILAASGSVRLIARLSELDPKSVLRAADELATVDLLEPGVPLAFVQPIVGAAVHHSISPLERAHAHARTAQVLTEEDASAEQIATHLLSAAPEGDPSAVDVLREAAVSALAAGQAERAVRLLLRALLEAPSSETRSQLLAELGRAEAQAGVSTAAERFADARKITATAEGRAALALAQGRALHAQGRYREAAAALEGGREELSQEHATLGQELTAAYVAAASLVPALQDRALELRDEILGALADQPSPSQRSAIAYMAVHDSLMQAPRSSVRDLADLAWGGGGQLDAEMADGFSLPLVGAALLVSDELERAIELFSAVLASPREPSPILLSEIRCCRAWGLLEQGRISDAEAEAELALASTVDGSRSYAQIACGVRACCHLERGQLEQAEAALLKLERQNLHPAVRDPLVLELRARLRLTQNRPREALQDASKAGRVLKLEFADVSPGSIPWRSTTALAHLALGEVDQARALAAEELAQARGSGVTRIVIRDLCVLGLATGTADRLELLREAVDAGEAYPPRLEHFRALIEFGAALRRANRRAEAREPLRRGLELSLRGGADVLASRAQTELAAAGARMRSPALSGVASLTVSQRRVAELAAQGLTTRQIADALFVTPKTVEFHLRQTYRKLGVSNREAMTKALNLS